MSKVLFARVSLVALSMFGAAACTVKSNEMPGLTGPSEFGVSVTMSATPDSLVRDGQSSSNVVITVRDPNGKPLPNSEFRLNAFVGSSLTDFGMFSPSTVVTGADGRATAKYTPPAASALLAGTPPVRVSITATPIGSNYQAAHFPSADVLVLSPPVPPQAPGSPVASLSYSPQSAHVGDVVSFNASNSQAAPGSTIVSYYWDFGDGLSHDEHGNDASHIYTSSGSFIAILAVTDNLGRSSSTFRTVTVSP